MEVADKVRANAAAAELVLVINNLLQRIADLGGEVAVLQAQVRQLIEEQSEAQKPRATRKP